MSEEFADIAARTRDWFDAGHALGLVASDDYDRFSALEHATPADLFTDAQARPLVVALFGGTGVGKSSLLNRLAGASIARVGVERPTSREITLYLHARVELASFPQTLPIDSVRVERHEQSRRREIMWVDMPDIDSTEPHNRECALHWLPHIDLVIYVVSPERYRDDAGWRVLVQRGQRHGWLFVMNHWDQGDRAQRDDFARMLRQAGFEDPLVLVTSCAPDAPPPSTDEFDEIERRLGELLADHGVRELTRLGHRARLQGLRRVLQESSKRLGGPAQWEALRMKLADRWSTATQTLWEGLEWPMRALAQSVARDERGPSWRKRVAELAAQDQKQGDDKPADSAADPTEVAERVAVLWDDWTAGKVALHLDALEAEARQAGLVVGNLRRQLDDVAGGAEEALVGPMQDAVRAALAQPGTRLQRAARRVTGFLTAMLPLAALAWVARNLLTQYFNASRGIGDYPGANFAIASGMLVLLAWGLPFWIDRLLRPSLSAAVLRALRQGLTVGLDDLGARIDAAVDQAAGEAGQHREAADKLLKQLAGVLVRPVRADRPALSRLVATPQPTEPFDAR